VKRGRWTVGGLPWTACDRQAKQWTIYGQSVKRNWTVSDE